MADTFGSGANQFNIDFVTISGDSNPASGYGIVNHDYRIGVYEITNEQWDKFAAELGMPITGYPLIAYDESASYSGANIPTNEMSWYKAAQFVNWLNTSSGYEPAYRFVGVQGTSDYTLSTWSAAEADEGTNLYRNKDAFYYLPTEHEWVKAAYWNGTALQSYATLDGSIPVAGVDANYSAAQPWQVGSGQEELNGTYDMMGNLREWMENPYTTGSYAPNANRVRRGGAFSSSTAPELSSTDRYQFGYPQNEYYDIGFRVAAEIPEPASISLLLAGGCFWLIRRRSA
jgi:formylglycine-generating enzyme required for sulfatase activity